MDVARKKESCNTNMKARVPNPGIAQRRIPNCIPDPVQKFAQECTGSKMGDVKVVTLIIKGNAGKVCCFSSDDTAALLPLHAHAASHALTLS